MKRKKEERVKGERRERGNVGDKREEGEKVRGERWEKKGIRGKLGGENEGGGGGEINRKYVKNKSGIKYLRGEPMSINGAKPNKK